MQKQLGAIFLVAGTTIGSGMIALPMVLGSLGICKSVLLMMIIWSLMYYTALINLELNLQAGKGLSLGSLGQLFSGNIANWTGLISLKLLSYALLAVFIYAGSSIIQTMVRSSADFEVNFSAVVVFYTIGIAFLLLWPIRWIDFVNRILFIGLLGVVIFLIMGLSVSIEWSQLPLVHDHPFNFKEWRIAIPVVFTSFGFQVIFHSLTNYCNKNLVMLRKAFFWGSLLPAVIYIVWTSSILSVLYSNSPAFYETILSGKVEVGDMINELSLIAAGTPIEFLIWWISILSIATSVIGVGLGLVDTWKPFFQLRVQKTFLLNLLSVFLTLVPPCLIAILIPNAFIKILGFAGMILVVIAILLPTYLFQTAILGKAKLYYPILRFEILHWFSYLAGFIIIACELINMM
ncbi:MAG: tyrp5 [Chlamydiales bacterium]|jgi:tyrosine-specific transport protein|nr:tyrp5 [Chlamydiales bacterium]